MSSPIASSLSQRTGRITFRRYGPSYRWLVLGVGSVALTAFAALFAGLPGTAVLMRAAYRMSTAQLGAVMGCVALGIMAGEMVWGLLTDRLGDRTVLLAGLTSAAAALLALALYAVPTASRVPSPWLLGAGLVLVGLLAGSANSASGRAIMAWFADGRRGLAMSIRQASVPLGGGLGVVLLPWLAQRSGFGAVFGSLAAMCVLSAVMIWLWLPAEKPEVLINGAPRAIAPATAQAPGSPLRRIDVWRLALAAGLLTIPQMAVLTFGSVYLHDHFGTSVILATEAILAVQCGAVVARLLTGRVADSGVDSGTLMKIIGAGTGVVGFALAFSTHASLATAGLLMIALGVFASAWHGIAYAKIAATAGPARAGTALGMIGMTVFASAFATPALFPHVMAHAGWAGAWCVAAVAALCAILVVPRVADR